MTGVGDDVVLLKAAPLNDLFHCISPCLQAAAAAHAAWQELQAAAMQKRCVAV